MPADASLGLKDARRIVPKIDSRKLLAAVRDGSPYRENAGVLGPAARLRTPLYIVASPRPRTGKTFLARLLTDFLCLDGSRARAFDIAPGTDALEDYLPATTVQADIGETQGQVALFDRLIVDDGIAKVIDLGSTAYQRFFAIVEDIGFIGELRRRAIEPVVLFAADAHPASADAYARLMQSVHDLIVVPVFSEAITPGLRLRERFPVRRAAAVPLRIPLLAPGLKAQADRVPHAFAVVHDEQLSEIPAALACELHAWSRRTFLEFRELQLRVLLEELRASLPGVRL